MRRTALLTIATILLVSPGCATHRPPRWEIFLTLPPSASNPLRPLTTRRRK